MTNQFKVSIFGVFVTLLSLAFLFPSVALAIDPAPASYTGCAGVALGNQCDWEEFNPDYCYDFYGDPADRIPHTSDTCFDCFIQSPQLPAGQGICILDADTTFMGPAPDNAPPIGATDDHCPVCPDGYQFNFVEFKCSQIGGTVSAPMQEIIRWDDCPTGQTCEEYSNGAGCKGVVGGGCMNIGPSDAINSTCGGTARPYTCQKEGDTYCCETQGQCVAAGGEQQLCIATGDLTPGTGDTSCASLFPNDFPQLCRVESWNGPTLNESNYCCFSQSACDAFGGQDRGVTNTRSVGEYDVCSSNLAGQGGALDLCNSCFAAEGIWTAVGCISQDPKDMISKLVNIGIGILGGIFLLRVLAAGFTLTISQGDVKKTTEAKDMITESVIGVLFILFSVTILQFIGSGVLKIPGFG